MMLDSADELLEALRERPGRKTPVPPSIVDTGFGTGGVQLGARAMRGLWCFMLCTLPGKPPAAAGGMEQLRKSELAVG